MHDSLKNLEPIDTSLIERKNQTGYTYLEILGVTALVVIVVLMTFGMTRNYKKFAIEETTVQRLKELARSEHVFRSTNDPSVNPEGTYGNFFDLQNAGLIPEIYAQSDERRHTVNAFVPHYRLDFVRNWEQTDLEPDAYQFNIIATPIYPQSDEVRDRGLKTYGGLKTFYVQEDGEVYFWGRGLWAYER